MTTFQDKIFIATETEVYMMCEDLMRTTTPADELRQILRGKTITPFPDPY